MAVLIGSARSNENGGVRGGKPGDQKNGLEVSTQDWYLHDKGWVVIRPIDSTVAEKIAHCMERACDNNLIGYDQDTSYQLFDALKLKGFDPDKLDKAVNVDCSSLVRVCCAYAGINTEWFSTYNEVAVLKATGKFNILTDSQYTNESTNLKRGDILCTKTQGHTVVVLSNGGGVNPVPTPTPTPSEKQKVTEPEVAYKQCAYVGKVTVEKTPVRIAPNTNADLQKEWSYLGKNNLVDVLGQTYDAKWSYIYIGKKCYGWVASNSMYDNNTNKVAKCLDTIQKKADVHFVAEVVKATTVRCGAGTMYEVSESWSKLGVGNMVEVIGCSADMKWVLLNIQGAKGWIPTSYIKKK